jgi:hypothetical protein
MEDDLGTGLEWTAVAHHNTEHPHVHVVVRGRREGGDALRLRRQYVQSGIREIAGDLCTRQLGYRTELDAAEAERREITEARFTSLDRRLLKDAPGIGSDGEPQYFAVTRNPLQTGLTETARLHTKHEAARQLVKRGIMPTEDGWGGWLGRYQSALCKSTREIEERNERDWVRKQERRRDRARGR